MVLALVMIVKNEEDIISRNLESTLPLVDTWVIVDTGSSDKTMEIIQSIADKHGKPGHLLQRPWVNFGHNRSELLCLAREKCDWALMMDADDFISGHIPTLDSSVDGYKIQCETTSTRFYRPQLFNSKCNWKFVGALHEYATGGASVYLDSLTIQARCEGNRSKNPQKYLNDANTLQEELLQPNCDTQRTLFYLAQSYRDAGIQSKARHFYKLRCDFGGWHEEQYISYLNLIRLTDCDKMKVELAWKGIRCNSKRREIPYFILQYFRKKSVWSEEFYAMGKTYLDCQSSPDFLFAETGAYGWSYLDELGLHAFYTNRKAIAKQLFIQSLLVCPEDQKTRMQANIDFCG